MHARAGKALRSRPFVIQIATADLSWAPVRRDVLERRDIDGLCNLMNRNFDLRRQMFGDQVRSLFGGVGQY